MGEGFCRVENAAPYARLGLMTPLARRIVSDTCKPLRDRRFGDPGNVAPRMGDAHCFEVSEVVELAEDLGRDLVRKDHHPDTLGFLPAPKTWIEFRAKDGSRHGYLLEDNGRGSASVRRAALAPSGAMGSHHYVGELLLSPSSWDGDFPALMVAEGRSESELKGVVATFYGFLAIINTPRIVGRKTHTPSVSLEKRVVNSRGIVGSFPLRAWTELVLSATPPDLVDGEVEAHFTGRKALHFVRAHLRIRLGKLELVSAHWRGDGSLGIKQSRYKVTI